jgi:hypothetical protein
VSREIPGSVPQALHELAAPLVEPVPDNPDGSVTPSRQEAPRWVAPLYLVLSLGLLPWVVVLATSLPDRSGTSNYRLAWVGFDVLLVASLARTAYLALRNSPFVVNVASVTAALLVVDAWFDVTTSRAGSERAMAILSAVLLELPIAALSLWIAGRAQVIIATTGVVHDRNDILPRVLRRRDQHRDQHRARRGKQPARGGSVNRP